MKKRALAIVLWSLTGWYIGAMAAWILSLPPVLPVVLAVAAGWVIGSDPRHVIWTHQNDRS